MNDRSVPDLTKQTAADLKRLAQLEIQLAVEGLRAQARSKATAAAAGAAGAVVALYALLLLFVAAALALALVLPMWASFLIVGGALLLAAGVLGAVAAAGFRARPSPSPREAVDQAKEDVRWVLEKSA